MALMRPDVMGMEEVPHTTSELSFWRDMPGRIRVRFALGLGFLLAAGTVLSLSPIAGIVFLMAPLLWSVLVTWFGSESGRGYGPYSQRRETAFAYTLRYFWQASAVMTWTLSIVIFATVVGGLGWISTEKMRIEASEPDLTERAVSAADRATEATKDVAQGWFATAKGWFTSDDEND